MERLAAENYFRVPEDGQGRDPRRRRAKAATALITVANPHANGGHSNTVYLPVRLPATAVAMTTDGAVTTAGGVTAGDFNSDGNLDVLVSTGAPLTVESFLGKGNGTFSHFVGATAQFFPTIGAFAADFNGDGKLNIALNMDNGFSEGQVFLGNGDGTFTSSGVGGGFGGEAIGAGDFHGNGKLDLVFSSVSPFGGTSYFTYAGNGDGTFGTAGILGVSGLVHGNPAMPISTATASSTWHSPISLILRTSSVFSLEMAMEHFRRPSRLRSLKQLPAW
jgi:hypothetical protein